MKTILFITFLIFGQLLFSQEKDIQIRAQDTAKPAIIAMAPDEDYELDEVPFAVIDAVPVFPGCEDLPQNERSTCFGKMITNHIVKNTNFTPEMIDAELQGKVFVTFMINKEGLVEEITTRGSHRILQKEAARVIAKLPKMQPGAHRGKPVKVRYTVPFNFQIQ